MALCSTPLLLPCMAELIVEYIDHGCHRKAPPIDVHRRP
jgi:hypothetical protein